MTQKFRFSGKAEYLQDEIDIYLEPANAELDLGDSDSAADRLNKALAADGATATLHNANGDLLATFGEGADPLYENAKLVVVSHRRASISLVQRELRIGYNRAARLIEQMEADGVVSAMDGSGSREVLVTAAEAA
jgi:DNA segregation ATPase FtsK/SpoIIIE-like protein